MNLLVVPSNISNSFTISSYDRLHTSLKEVFLVKFLFFLLLTYLCFFLNAPKDRYSILDNDQ